MRKAELIVALDLPSVDDIPAIVDALPASVRLYKIGLELFTRAGPESFERLKKRDKKIFLDLKLHDIPRTVARAVTAAARHGVDLLTIHAGGGRDMLQAAAEAASDFGQAAPRLVAVTTLTSLNSKDLKEMGVSRPLTEHTLALGQLAIESGIDGLVCSPLEVSRFRDAIGHDPILVAPGIRPAQADAGDQKRVATPAAAVQAGADFLVVGRPILQAPDPKAAAQAILQEMTQALK